MRMMRTGAWTAPFALLAAAFTANAQGQHNPTYFGLPGAGPSGPVYKNKTPSTFTLFGDRFTRSAETDREKYERQYRIAMGQHIAAMNRLHDARPSTGYVYGDPRTSVVPLGGLNANRGQGFGQEGNDHLLWHAMHPLQGLHGGHEGHACPHCGKAGFGLHGCSHCGHGAGQGCKDGHCGVKGCATCQKHEGGAGQGCNDGSCGVKGCASCQKHFGQACPHCGKAGFGHFGCPHCGHGVGRGGHGRDGYGRDGDGAGPGAGAGGPPYYSAYPGMNREDAVRYIEGFQYVPPYQLLRSPRDFFMFDVKYNLGK